MNKQGSKSEQFFRFLILAFVGMLLFQQFTGSQKGPQVEPRPARTLEQAWKNINPDLGPPLSRAAAEKEVGELRKLVEANPADGLADWARLRMGLLHQYVLGDLKKELIPSGFLGMGAKVNVFPIYQELINRAQGDGLEAQAIYQQGDLLWRESIKGGGHPSGEAAGSLEMLIHKGRSSSAFLDQTIYVPREVEPAKVPLEGLPPGGFRTVKVSDLHGKLGDSNPQGILDRVNKYYSSSTYFRLFDGVVNLFGANPTYSYGLAVLAFAIVTRLLLQPLNKKQYDSMKGMSVIAPEMKKIQERYKGKTDQQAQMQMVKEIQALQKRHGVNPYLGCGLAFLQMPIFFLFVYPLIQHYEPKMELAQASFLWINSLAQRDILLLVLYGISMFFSFRLSSTPPADDMQRQQQMIMSIAMPIMFPFFIATYPSAFTLYWMTYNVVSTFFQWRMMKAADPKKNVIKTLMGTDAPVVVPAVDAVPPRPKEEKAEKKGGNTASAQGSRVEPGSTGSEKKKKKK